MNKILNRTTFPSFKDAIKKEYLITNRMGGYASSTIVDCHSRKHHGLLVVPLKKYLKSYNLLSKFDVSLIYNKIDIPLSTNKFSGVYAPKGYNYIRSFEMELYPITKFCIGNIEITRSLIMPSNTNSILIRYDVLKADRKIKIKGIPFLAYRDIHSTMKENMDIRQRTYFEKNGFKIDPYHGMPALYMQTSSKSDFYPSPEWWKNFEFLEEKERGYDYQEDLFSPGIFEAILKQDESFIIRASIDKPSICINEEWEAEVIRTLDRTCNHNFFQ